jgi:endonuclease/exonuclease/phosphatase family metal-dependent hydrolase
MRHAKAARLLLLGMLLALLPVAADAAEPALRVMSFNIRYGTANDGENAWPKRRDYLIEVIREFDPDLLGTQEVLASQADFLAEKLADYTLVGVGRDDGKRRGEFSAALYKKARFEPVDSGTFWLSETPDKPGSKSWDSSLPRVATWVRLRDKQADGRELLWLNTHWDHRGRQARVEAGKLIRRWINEHAAGSPTILTGDLNVPEDNEGFRALVTSEGEPRLFDAYRKLHPEAQPDEGTFHGFNGGTRGRRIDFVLGTAELRVTEADILRASRAGLYPSDHYPVTAVLSIPAKPKP